MIRRVARRSYPQAAVTLEQVERLAPVFFRALGGSSALTLKSAVGSQHGARRRFIERIAGIGERAEFAWADDHSFFLPATMDAFASPDLNRDVYLWLIALLAFDGGEASWFERNVLASRRVLAALPGFVPLYRRLVAAHLAQRAPAPAPAAAFEHALRRQLTDTAAALAWSGPVPAHEPVPLWLHPSAPAEGAAAAPRSAQDNAGGKSQDGKRRRRYRTRRETPDERCNGMLLVFRAESIFTWDEYVKVNRHQDEDDGDSCASAAEDMDRLTLADGTTKAGRLRFDLDLPAAAYDDTPLGPGILLPEWHWRQQRLVPAHCHLKPMYPASVVAQPLPEHLRRTARSLRRQFQALAPERQRRSGEMDGPQIDLDRLIAFLSERRHGNVNAEPALYQAWPRAARSLACLTLADLSLSTESWAGSAGRVIDVIRDSLLLFGEALDACGDAFGVYGFSSIRRSEVRYLLLKDFSGPWDDLARGRIMALRPGYYTRLGAAIRHSASILAGQPAARKLLLILSDGKPNDLDHYEGRYGIEDTRQAVLEARRAGLVPFCVTVDAEGSEYLPHLFGANGYVVVTDPRRLPAVLTRLYSTLTR
nr:nitric oxide reductase [Crenobacter caeni]